MQWHTCGIYRRLVFMLSSSWNLHNSATVGLLGPQNVPKEAFLQFIFTDHEWRALWICWHKFAHLLLGIFCHSCLQVLSCSLGPMGWEVSLPSSLRAAVLCIWGQMSLYFAPCSFPLIPKPLWMPQPLENTPAARPRDTNDRQTK